VAAFFAKRSAACSGSGHKFESYIVHQNETTPFGVVFLFGMVLEIGLEQINCKTPVEPCGHQFKNWWLPLKYSVWMISGLDFLHLRENFPRKCRLIYRGFVTTIGFS